MISAAVTAIVAMAATWIVSTVANAIFALDYAISFAEVNVIFAPAVLQIDAEHSLASNVMAASMTLTCFYSSPLPVASGSLATRSVLATSFELVTVDCGVSVATVKAIANGIYEDLPIDSSICFRNKQYTH